MRCLNSNYQSCHGAPITWFWEPQFIEVISASGSAFVYETVLPVA